MLYGGMRVFMLARRCCPEPPSSTGEVRLLVLPVVVHRADADDLAVLDVHHRRVGAVLGTPQKLMSRIRVFSPEAPVLLMSSAILLPPLLDG